MNTCKTYTRAAIAVALDGSKQNRLLPAFKKGVLENTMGKGNQHFLLFP